LSQIVQADWHPPLYYWLLHYWVALFGTSEVAVRSLSVLFGALAIPVIYLLGRRLFNEEAGLLAALILAFSTLNVQYSQEARMYSLMVLLALLSMYFFLRLLHKSNLAIAAGYVLATTLMLYTHIYGLFVLLAQNIYLVSLIFLSREKTVRPAQWIALQAIVVGLFALWIPVLMSNVTSIVKGGEGYWITTPTLKMLMSSFVMYAGGVVNSEAALTYASGLLSIVFLVLSVLALFRYTKLAGSMDWKAPLKALQSYAWDLRIANVEPVYFLSVWLVIINIIPFIISFYDPIYLARYTIAASVALYLLVARGINNINHKYAKLAVIGIIVVLSAANLLQ
jgi:mannosyltransferase